MPGTPSGLNHSLDIQACGRSRMPRSSSSSWSLWRQSSSQVPSTTTLRLLSRRLSKCSSDSDSQSYFRRALQPQTKKYPLPGWWDGSLPATTEPSPHGPVNEISAPGYGKSHAEHNTSGLPSIATDARTLRHFSRVPEADVRYLR